MSAELERVYRENFKEIKPPLKPEEARLEASRCLYCYDAPCVRACPTHIDVPRFIKQIASDNLKGSAKTILEANPLGHSCARACPVEVLCEGACVYHEWQDHPIQIAKLQRRATDYLHELGGAGPFKPAPDNGHRVAVIGAGPAGISCAVYLRRLGYAVTIFEKEKVPGGLNTFGIAEYKMGRKVSLAEAKMAFALGVKLSSGKEVGKDILPRSLLEDFSAIFIATGLGSTQRLGVPGEDLPGVWEALAFIRHVKNRELSALGSSALTVVIGGGNTAIDAATQSKRIGTPRVVMAYRRSAAEMGAYGFEYELAKQDEAEFLWNSAPVRIIGRKKVEGVEFQKTRVKGGKLHLLPGSHFTIACDRVIKAIGQSQLRDLAQAMNFKLDKDGRIAVNPETLRTSVSKIFAGGDAINGGKEVVNAAADGKRAALAIHRFLMPAAELSPENRYWARTIESRPAEALHA